jgi:hypothetical protein
VTNGGAQQKETNGSTQKETNVLVQEEQGGGDIRDTEVPTTSVKKEILQNKRTML